MKKISISVICLVFMLLVTSCEQRQEQKTQVTDYSVTKVDESLSDDDVTMCLNALGLRFQRFTCMIPKRTGITVSSKVYKDGQEIREPGSGTIYVDKGLQDFILFMKKDQNRVSFIFASPVGSTRFSSISVEGYLDSTYGWIPIDELSPEAKPIYIYAANTDGGIEGFTGAAEDIDVQIAEYDFAVVIYASIGNSKAMPIQPRKSIP